jgi:ABC-type amino acid transport substrate-binding protein
MRAVHSLQTATAVAALSLAAACGGDGASAGAEAEGAFKTAEEGCLTVAFQDGSLPRIAAGEGGKSLEGFQGVLLTEVAERNDLDLCLFSTDFASMVVAVSQGKADVATSLYYTEERAEQVRYTRPDVYDALTFIYADSTNFTGPESLKGLKAVTVASWTYTPPMEEFFGKENMIYAPGTTELMEMLRGGQADVSIVGGSGPAVLVASDPKSDLDIAPLEEGDLGIPESSRISPEHMVVNCGNPELAYAIDEVLVEWTESGRWAEVLNEVGIANEEPLLVPTSVESPEPSCNS